MNVTSLIQSSVYAVRLNARFQSQVEYFQLTQPHYFLNIADFLCAFTSVYFLRYTYKSYMHGVPLVLASFLMCFGCFYF